ncbi:nitrogen fixation/metabolism regulation signal transduction histidine kinase [Parabacteroides sp. PF5-5]|nr:nitrogen fixation/metabolism regulation signal transduction histidine kinase [Parabacteroides sp. PH5-39]MDH6316598.1 nitrogen fixation/metabolism regulation signal transduction histidine kinase [Parabacteroides sp. PF5-13]MDH6320222.1 nitrogen fixation/metabolism regulation signal transduction histidine kinase [Parabacteroides sp. PH5-13]MDH6323835.1 nitrogen fixation/metabolism regulation signal transduction histidine kinase [Parabacteroides sp. PH5-8]MDH6327899.1 nitrogen fixation/metabol
MFACIEVLVVVTAIYLFIFYRSIIKPLQVIGDGMDLLKEQDFSSRLRQVGQPEADRIVDVFNKMMEQLKNERLHLREQNHFLDLLIQASPMGVIILDLDQQVLSINPAACKMFNIKSEEDISGKHLVEIDSLLATELLLIEQYTSQTIRLSDANIYKCTHSSFINRGFHQSFYLIESLTEEVFKAEKKAYEKVIRMIAHEVNNTTAGITSTLDTLDNTFKQLEGTEDICEVLQVAIERCYSMSRFITNFADVVRIPEPQLQEHDLNSLVIAGKRFMENVCLNRNIKINMELSEVSPIIQVDSLLFEQVLLNIIKNSAESIGHNGQIYIRTTADPVRLEIADTGKGIDKETETKLFSPFFSTKPNGQGLGLIFIREVLLKHGYTFSLRTYNDGLTRFVIML